LTRTAIAFVALSLVAAPAAATPATTQPTVIYEPTTSVMDGPAVPILVFALLAVLLTGND